MNATRRDRYWLEGRADAIVDLVGAKLVRARADEIADALGIPHEEMRRAVRRRPVRLRRGGGPVDIRRPRLNVPDGHKRCPMCNRVKPLGEFGMNRHEADGHTSYCRPCQNTYNKERRLARKKAA